MSRIKVELRMPPRSAFDNFERETKARLQGGIAQRDTDCGGAG
ncbi:MULTISPECIES: hypothetical protein [unclassified Sphingopyxis]|nr:MULTISPECIES: hypothetical protein [unclassified Sphingopyxis]